MLHRYYLILMLLALFIVSPQVTSVVLADESINESVYDNINKEQTEKSNGKEPSDNNQDTELEPADQNDSLSVTPFDFIKMIFALAFVLLLIYLLLKFVTKRKRLFQQGQSIMNLGGTNLGQNKSIQMIKVGNRVLIVGVGESISLLKEIEDVQERKELIEEFERKQEQIVEPKDIIQKVSLFVNQGVYGKRLSVNENPYLISFKEQLDKVKNERTKQLEEVKRKGLNKHE